MQKSRHARRAKLSGQPAISRARKWAYRIVAMLLPLVGVVVLELGLRLASSGYPASFFLPAKAGGQAVLTENPQFTRSVFGPALARAPWPFQIPAEKAPDTVRIFLLGESAAYGDPQPEYGLSRILETLLRARYPQSRFEVVNASMTGINSHVLLPVARECSARSADLLVVYMGNNEVIGPYGAGTIFGRQVPGLAFIRASLALKATRTGQLLDSLLRRLSAGPAARREWEGMKMFLDQQVPPGDPRMAAVYRHFERNLADIIRAGKHGQARVVLSTVASNLRDCAPFASLHRLGLTEAQLRQWRLEFDSGCQAQAAGNHADAAASFRRAAQIDDQFAELHFRWAQSARALKQFEDARRHYELARDCDALKFRADSRLNALIRQAAGRREAEGIFLADAEAELMRQSPEGICGQEWFWEHVHFTFEGNYHLARIIVQQVEAALPASVRATAESSADWLSRDECARRLAFGDEARYRAAASMVMRISEPPFPSQSNHGEQLARLQNQVLQLKSATYPSEIGRIQAQCRYAREQWPSDWVLQRQMAQALELAGELPAAVEMWKGIIHAMPNVAEAWCGLGDLLCRQAQPEEAVQAYQAGLGIQPESSRALNGLALAFALQGRHQEAWDILQRLLRLHPELPEAHLNAARILNALPRAADVAPHARFAFDHRPGDPDFLGRLAVACRGLGWTNEACIAWSEALRINPTDASAHLNLGVFLHGTGEAEQAFAHFQRAVEFDPGQAEARVRLGTELGRRGRHAEAFTQFAEAVRLQPGFVHARLNLGIALVRQQRFSEAGKEFQAVLRLDPGNVIARQQLQGIQTHLELLLAP